jgi:hypothetical protein
MKLPWIDGRRESGIMCVMFPDRTRQTGSADSRYLARRRMPHVAILSKFSALAHRQPLVIPLNTGARTPIADS